ncbi:hypothetical protein, partial [Nostoc flagelliforme]|uniref:hypothetical protein n=1 Tax=Nostoc flagelliforme TaxID=1306274 RepID=UPI001A7EF241
ISGLKKKEICELLETRRAEIESKDLVVFMVDECHLLWGASVSPAFSAPSTRAFKVELPLI